MSTRLFHKSKLEFEEDALLLGLEIELLTSKLESDHLDDEEYDAIAERRLELKIKKVILETILEYFK